MATGYYSSYYKNNIFFFSISLTSIQSNSMGSLIDNDDKKNLVLEGVTFDGIRKRSSLEKKEKEGKKKCAYNCIRLLGFPMPKTKHPLTISPPQKWSAIEWIKNASCKNFFTTQKRRRRTKKKKRGREYERREEERKRMQRRVKWKEQKGIEKRKRRNAMKKGASAKVKRKRRGAEKSKEEKKGNPKRKEETNWSTISKRRKE